MRRGQRKGENGRVLIVGGSEKYVGAPALAGLAALRSGCDIATIASPEKAAYAINGMASDLITIKLKGPSHLHGAHIKQLEGEIGRADCILVGNGLGTHPDTKKALLRIIGMAKCPIVVDADAITLLSGKRLENCVITPHSKEFEAFFGTAPSEALVKKNAGKDFIVLLKGKVDLISDGKRLKRNKTGNDAMTVGGTGDVLAGLVAGFIAQGMPIYEAACSAAYVNGKAGNIAFKKLGHSLLASDLLDFIPMAKKSM